MSYRLSVDVGGTFTDIVFFEETTKKIHITKTPSTTEDQSIGVINGIKKIAEMVNLSSYQDIIYFIHGTTVATNALLERKGAKTALITSEGFRDVFEIARQRRPHLYDFWAKRPKPPIPRYLVFEIPERILYDGTISKQLDENKIIEICKILREEKIESIAICLINSYSNPLHELKLKDLVLKELPNVYISTSYETIPEIREYERTCTTAVNAYLMPKVQKYINNLVTRKNNIGIKPIIHIMQSNGGIMNADIASQRSIHTVFSGPAGGVLAGLYLSKLIDEPNTITLDIGGTSSDIVLINNFKIKLTTNGEIGTFPIKVPMIDMHTIGTGGGSIAWVDAGGALKVGPKSAGAEPGPACYGLGGEFPTVTDANLVCGRLSHTNFLGGEKPIYMDKSIDVIQRKIANKINLSLIDSASGILDIVNSNMCGGVQVISTQKGYEIRDFSLIAFGGAGSLHAAVLSETLDMKKTIIPISPGNFSAIGCMLAEVRYDYVRTLIKEVSLISIVEYHELISEMKKEAISHLYEEGYSEEQVIFDGIADMRYSGQAWEIPIAVPTKLCSKRDLDMIKKSFEKNHKILYGFTLPDEDIVVVNLRLSAIGLTQKLQIKPEKLSTKGVKREALKGEREVFYNSKYQKFKIYNREQLLPGNEFIGPAIIEEYAASSVIPPGKKVNIDEYKNIVILNKE